MAPTNQEPWQVFARRPAPLAAMFESERERTGTAVPATATQRHDQLERRRGEVDAPPPPGGLTASAKPPDSV